MRILTLTGLVCLLLSTSANAEVFSCKQADGTTVFSYVPCRVETEQRKEPAETPTDPVVEVEFVAKTSRDYTADISALEAKLDQLHDARESEIAAAPFSTSNPDLLNNLKAEIRASYQVRIDENLRELVQLRTEQKRLR